MEKEGVITLMAQLTRAVPNQVATRVGRGSWQTLGNLHMRPAFEHIFCIASMQQLHSAKYSSASLIGHLNLHGTLRGRSYGGHAAKIAPPCRRSSLSLRTWVPFLL